MNGKRYFFPSRPGPMNGAVFTKIKIPLMPGAHTLFTSLRERERGRERERYREKEGGRER